MYSGLGLHEGASDSTDDIEGNRKQGRCSNSGEGRCSFAEGVGLYQNSDGRGKGENEVGKRRSDECRSSDTESEVVGNWGSNIDYEGLESNAVSAQRKLRNLN